MAKARSIIKRRKAVQNIRKITRTMQLIATARYQAALNRATKAKPYTEKITEMAAELARTQKDIRHPLLETNEDVNKSVELVLTANRGLCGGYNSSIMRTGLHHIQSLEQAGQSVDLFAYGKKGIAFYNFQGREMARKDTRFEDKPQFAEVEPIATELMAAYERKEISAVYVTYMRFVSVATQRVETIQLLPIEPPARAESQESPEAETGSWYEFSPPADELLAELLPEVVKVRLYQCFMDAAVSEQVARMVAMRSATDAANDMVRNLSQQYNRARQTQITLELLDIVGGAEALSG